MAINFTQKELIDFYRLGGWDLIKRQKDTEQFRRDAERIIHAADVRYNKLADRSVNESSFYSQAYENTRAGKVGQKTGGFVSEFQDINRLKSELYRAVVFLDDETSTVTGTRQQNKETRSRMFKKGARGQTAREEKARWDVFNQFLKNNRELISRQGEVGGWLTSDQLQELIQEYQNAVVGGKRELMRFLRDRVSEMTGIPKSRIKTNFGGRKKKVY